MTNVSSREDVRKTHETYFNALDNGVQSQALWEQNTFHKFLYKIDI